MRRALKVIAGIGAAGVLLNAVISLEEYHNGEPNTLKWVRPWS